MKRSLLEFILDMAALFRSSNEEICRLSSCISVQSSQLLSVGQISGYVHFCTVGGTCDAEDIVHKHESTFDKHTRNSP